MNTPETDALLETDWHHVDDDITDTPAYNRMIELCRKMERERDNARTPICIGRPIIEILAKDGMWQSMNGNSVVAANSLFQKNPYSERDEARELFGSSKRARKSLSDACDFLQTQLDEARQAMRDANRATMDANTRAGMGETLPCNWQQNEDGQWASTCGEMFEFTWLAGPDENRFKHCPFCGQPLTEPKS